MMIGGKGKGGGWEGAEKILVSGKDAGLQGGPGTCFPGKFWQITLFEMIILHILRVILKKIYGSSFIFSGDDRPFAG